MACGAVALVVVSGQYGFHSHAAPDGGDTFNRPMADKIAELGSPTWCHGIVVADRHWRTSRLGATCQGKSPWFSCSAIVAATLPFGVLTLPTLGAFQLWPADHHQ
jgi:hypothetical protein